MQIFFSFYQLKRKQKSNSQTHSLFQKGALIKVVDDDGYFGVADLCPWPELGDLTLEQEISEQGVLFQRTLDLARDDLLARRQKKILVSNISIKNHILVTDFENFIFQEPNYIYKIKGTKDFKKLAGWLNENVSLFQLLRLDFNSCLSENNFREFLKELHLAVIKKIEVIEDPFPFNLDAWNELRKAVPLAIDFEKGRWPVQISKPVRQNPEPQPLYLTSNMDHPVGLAHGLRFAQMYPDKTHGFLTLDIYEKNLYAKDFQQSKNEISYHADGFGIGFTSLLNKENWVPEIKWSMPSETIILFNPQAHPEEIRSLFKIKNNFAKNHPNDHLLISSSGSTQKPGDLKVFAFHKSSLLNSAERIVKYFNLTSSMNWGCVLPLFHVGGLGVLARAHLAQAKIFYLSWAEWSVEWLVENNIQLLSLVPTQVFDIVNQKLQAPDHLRHVFVGGAALDPQIEMAARTLGWPLELTYGMTETASMIALKTPSGHFKTFPGVEIFERSGHFYVQCNSKAVAQITLTDEIISQEVISDVELPDLIEMKDDGHFIILGRRDDQIKINGELVNLGRIRSMLPSEFGPFLDVVATPDDRKGYNLVLVGEKIAAAQLRQIAQELNLNMKKFEKIDFIVTLKQFPRSALHKILKIELINMVKASGTYEKL